MTFTQYVYKSVTFIHSYDTLKYNSRERLHIKVHFCTHCETITGYNITIHTIIYKKIRFYKSLNIYERIDLLIYGIRMAFFYIKLLYFKTHKNFIVNLIFKLKDNLAYFFFFKNSVARILCSVWFISYYKCYIRFYKLYPSMYELYQLLYLSKITHFSW